jgi:hypothetical protein
MPIPSFTLDGVLPPYVGPNGPGGRAEDLSPYECSAVEVVTTFGTTPNRQDVLRRWLDHRSRLRAIGLDIGFQWLDGSFVEQKEPRDLDIVSFTFRPQAVVNLPDWQALVLANRALFERGAVKNAFRLDAFFVDLHGHPEITVEAARYLIGLFSHRRGDGTWKGMLKVRLENRADDADAIAMLGQPQGGPGVIGP